MKKHKGLKILLISIAVGIVGTFCFFFFLGVLIGVLGDSDEVVETIKENRNEIVEEDKRKENIKTPKPKKNKNKKDSSKDNKNDDTEDVGDLDVDIEEDDNNDFYIENDGSFVEYTYGDSTVFVPLFIDDYIMGTLSADEQESLLTSILSYVGQDVNELINSAISIPGDSSARELARSGYVGNLCIFDAEVDTIGSTNTFAGSILGDDSVESMGVDFSFIGQQNLMSGDRYNIIAIYAGLNYGDPTFIALNMELL